MLAASLYGGLRACIKLCIVFVTSFVERRIEGYRIRGSRDEPLCFCFLSVELREAYSAPVLSHKHKETENRRDSKTVYVCIRDVWAIYYFLFLLTIFVEKL